MGPPGSQTGEEALRGTGRGKRLLAAVAVALVGIALFPAVAHAWTPGTHIYLGESVLANLRSEEHTSELQSRLHLVCRLLLEKKKKHKNMTRSQSDNEHKRTSNSIMTQT